MPKINTKRDMRCCDLPYVTAEGGSRLQAHLYFRTNPNCVEVKALAQRSDGHWFEAGARQVL